MSQRIDLRTLLLTVAVVFSAGNAGALNCSDSVRTDIVYVKFDGCSTAQPGSQFEVIVNGKTITVSKLAGTGYWTGRTANLFVIKDASLTVRADAMPAARVACKTKAAGRKHGPCVAEFVVGCEPLWRLQVDKTGDAKVVSERKNTTIAECPEDPFRSLTGPGEVELTVSEQFVVTLQKRATECVSASIAYKPFRVDTPFRISDVQLTRLCSARSTMNDTYAQEDLLKRQALKLFPDVVFIKRNLPKRTSEE